MGMKRFQNEHWYPDNARREINLVTPHTLKMYDHPEDLRLIIWLHDDAHVVSKAIDRFPELIITDIPYPGIVAGDRIKLLIERFLETHPIEELAKLVFETREPRFHEWAIHFIEDQELLLELLDNNFGLYKATYTQIFNKIHDHNMVRAFQGATGWNKNLQIEVLGEYSTIDTIATMLNQREDDEELCKAIVRNIKDKEILQTIAYDRGIRYGRDEAMDKLNNPSIAREILERDDEVAVKAYAIRLIEDPTMLKEIILGSDEQHLRATALRTLLRIRNHQDLDFLLRVVKEGTGKHIRSDALRALYRSQMTLDTGFLKEIIADLRLSLEVKRIALSRLEDQKVLRDLIEQSIMGNGGVSVFDAIPYLRRIQDLDELLAISRLVDNTAAAVQIQAEIENREKNRH